MRIIFLLTILTQTVSSLCQTYKAGLILPENYEVESTCCIYLPPSGFTLYEKAQENSIAACLLPGEKESGRKEFYQLIVQKPESEEVVSFHKLEMIGYEVFAIPYQGIENGFIQIFDGLWVKLDELKQKGYRHVNWMDFMVKESGKVLGYYANEPGLNLRKGPSTDFDQILTLKGDVMEINLSPEIKGLWNKVKVFVFKEHPCESGPDAVDTLAVHQGWIKLLDDSGTPNVWCYRKGC